MPSSQCSASCSERVAHVSTDSGESFATTTEGECYVCTGDGQTEPLLVGICGCRHMALHASCQQRLMSTTRAHATSCAVCSQPYKNVSFEEVTVKDGDSEGEDSAVLNVCSIICIFHFIGSLAGCLVCSMLLIPVTVVYCLVFMRTFTETIVKRTPVVHTCVPSARLVRLQAERRGASSICHGLWRAAISRPSA